MGLFDKLFGKNNDKKDEPKDNAEALLQDVEVAPGILIPQVLQPFWPRLQAGKKTCVSIKASPAEVFTLQQSKFYHYPCIPKNYPYPLDKAGKYMIPLAQINFSECPRTPIFPSSGYLQFYIADDEMYGLNFDDQLTQEGFKVLYFKEEDVIEPHQDFSFLENVMKAEYSPVYQPHQLVFSIKEEYFSMNDYRGTQVIDPILAEINKTYHSIKDRLSDIMYQRFQSNGHKLGGYAYFTQSDPREHKKEWRDRVLLFQIDSDDEIMWGDVGVANFFIRPFDLQQLNFSSVLYNWDCC